MCDFSRISHCKSYEINGLSQTEIFLNDCKTQPGKELVWQVPVSIAGGLWLDLTADIRNIINLPVDYTGKKAKSHIFFSFV